jgi:hypothetical protein
MAAGTVSGNHAVDGGGIFTEDYDYRDPADPSKYMNINMASGTANVSGNVSGETVNPPSNYLDFTDRSDYPFDGLLLNNDNVNYRNHGQPDTTITYKPNNGGSPAYANYVQNTYVAGTTTVTIATQAIAGFVNPPTANPTWDFRGWNTKADGSGISYAPGASASVTGYLTLYAQWGPLPITTTLTITKVVTGDYADISRDFSFNVYFQDSNGIPLAAGTQFNYVGEIVNGSGAAAPASGTLTLDGNGKAEITLKHGQGICIEDVKNDAKIRVEEIDASGYNTSFNDSAEASSTAGADTGVRDMTPDEREFDFINARVITPPTGIDMGSFEGFLPLSLLIIALGVTASALSKAQKFHKKRI